ncbi:MAG: tetratricopeptide repeat protein, partial [Chitinophagaceae bacterium]
EERARWEYLAGQLYALSKDLDKAAELFEAAAQHTLNPVLEVYARLNAIRQHPSNEQAISKNIADLIRMARREKYVNYRDIIYYSAAQMELERNQLPAAKALLQLSTATSSNFSLDRAQKSRSFLLLADLSFQDGSFSDAKNYYDSVQNKELIKDQQSFDQRKTVLAKLAQNDLIIQRQDSVQKIARMPEAEREALLKKMVKKIRKEQGLKEEEATFIPGSGAASTASTAAPPDLFDNAAKGEWYFYNTSLKSKGFTEFRNKWGNRPNMDNWRRASAVTKSIQLPSADLKPVEGKAQVTGNEPKGVTLASLLKGIPLSPEQLLLSNDSIKEAQFAIGKILMEGLEEYERGIQQLEEFRDNYPGSTHEADALASLYFGYTKTGDMAKAAAVKQLLESRFKDSEFEKKTRPPVKDATAATGEADMTRRYEKIYTLFIEGNFSEALAEKKQADSLYQKNYWTPQLLYIQSLYYIRQRMDDTAKAVLNDLIKLYPKHLLAGKAKTLIEVLGRRAEIEFYLTQLKVDRPKEEILYEPAPVKIETVIVKKAPAAPADSTQQPAQNVPKEDIANNPPPTQQPVAPALNPAPAADSANKPPAPVAERKENAPPAPVEPAAPQPAPAPVQPPVTAATKDLSVKPERNSFVAEPEAAHLVMIILDKVEGIYVNEAKNAFNRWNQQNYYDKPLEINSEPPAADNIRLIFLKPFTNAAEALAYMEKVRKVAESEIVPWLPAEKYSFGVISEKNREVLLNGHTIAEYKNFLKTAYPGKF